MGRKKGKQAGDFHSKQERGNFRRKVSIAAETAREEERAAADYSRREGETHRPRLKAGTLNSLRDFLSQRRVAADPTDAETTADRLRDAVLKEAAAAAAEELAQAQAGILRSLAPPPAQTLAERCAEVIGATLSCYDGACSDTREAFSWVPPALLSRISAVASARRELSDDNAALVAVSGVETLVLHGSITEDSICGLLLLPSCCDKAAAAAAAAAAAEVAGGSIASGGGSGAGAALLGSSSAVVDDWEESYGHDDSSHSDDDDSHDSGGVPSSLWAPSSSSSSSVFSRLVSLSVSSVRLEAAPFLRAVATALPQLQRLHLHHCTDTLLDDGTNCRHRGSGAGGAGGNDDAERRRRGERAVESPALPSEGLPVSSPLCPLTALPSFSHSARSLCPPHDTGARALVAAVGVLTDLEHLDVSACPFLADSVLLDVVRACPVVLTQQHRRQQPLAGAAGAEWGGGLPQANGPPPSPLQCAPSASSPPPSGSWSSFECVKPIQRLRLRRLICRGTRVTPGGVREALAWVTFRTTTASDAGRRGTSCSNQSYDDAMGAADRNGRGDQIQQDNDDDGWGWSGVALLSGDAGGDGGAAMAAQQGADGGLVIVHAPEKPSWVSAGR